MSLSQPNYDGLFKLDEKLSQLQKEVQFLEQEYGFSEEHLDLATTKTKPPLRADKTKKKAESPKKLKGTTLNKENRYKNLPEVKVSDKEVPKKIIKPEIDPAWKDANKIKPNLMTFYDESVYQRKYVDMSDFSTKPICFK